MILWVRSRIAWGLSLDGGSVATCVSPPLADRNGWTIAEAADDDTPDGTQRLSARHTPGSPSSTSTR
jgi:hypothetical protein